MASLASDSNGRRRLQFTDSNGKRKTVRLGKIPKRIAEAIKTRVEYLLMARISKQPIDSDTARWVSDLDDVLYERLSRVGLIRPRESALLGDYIDAYVEGRTDLKPRTIIKFNATKNYLIDFFGADRRLRDITSGDAADWRVFLLGRGMAENTTRKHAQIAKQFFTAAVKRRLIEVSPFTDLKSTIQSNPERYYFISRDEAEKVLDACPDAEWRLIFALSRFGGLRCPSEHLALTWDCIDWANERIRIPSPKTEHHAGKGSRIIPIFPELRPYLEEVFDRAAEGSVYVINRYRDSNTNLRTQLTRIIYRAGLDPWPKLFQNLRSSRETELAEKYPIHVACAWIGNTEAVAARHYLQVTEDHFKKATQKATQTVHDRSDSGGQEYVKTAEMPPVDCPDNQGQSCTHVQVAGRRLELLTCGL